MNKTFTMIGVSIVAASLSLAGASAANASQPKTVICHATSSVTNPWVQIEVANPSLKAHAKHGDLIPAPVGGCPVPVTPPVDVPVDPPVDVPVDPIDPPVEPPYTPPVVDCAEGTVPGILNEQGDPTACVSNNPCPEVAYGQTCPVDEPEIPIDESTAEPVTPVVVPVEPTALVELPTVPVAELAYTGANDVNPFPYLAIGSMLLAAGAFLIRKAARA